MPGVFDQVAADLKDIGGRFGVIEKIVQGWLFKVVGGFVDAFDRDLSGSRRLGDGESRREAWTDHGRGHRVLLLIL